MRKIGLFGGTFDPPHQGHLRPVKAARQALDLERVIFLPTARPPHKPERHFVPAFARFAMVELALLDEEGLFVSGYELTPGKIAYTIHSVEHFRRQYEGAEIYLIIGGDSFAELPTWKRWRDLAELAHLAVLVRPGWQPEDLLQGVSTELADLARSDRVDFIANEPVDVSSTELRDLLQSGAEPPAGSLPPLVLQYLQKYRLYR